jgi:hypothetical protein
MPGQAAEIKIPVVIGLLQQPARRLLHGQDQVLNPHRNIKQEPQGHPAPTA